MGLQLIDGKAMDTIPPYAEEISGNPWVPSYRAHFGSNAKDKFAIEFNTATTQIGIKGARNSILPQITCILAFLGRVATVSGAKSPASHKGESKDDGIGIDKSSKVAQAIFKYLEG